jgi:hypothetical protein
VNEYSKMLAQPAEMEVKSSNFGWLRFSVAPMMDWTECDVDSITCERACAKFAHVRSPFLLFSLVSPGRPAVSYGTIGHAKLRANSPSPYCSLVAPFPARFF